MTAVALSQHDRRGRAKSIARAGIVLAIVLTAPLAALAMLALSASGEYLAHLLDTRLATYAANSLVLAAGAGLLAIAIGVGGAWIVTRFEFPLRRVFSVLLILPLAMPGYVAAYSWYAMTAPGSPAPLYLGDILTTVAGTGGAILVFALTLYPYVYLLARNALEANGALMWDIARSLGARPAEAFRRVTLPLVWPAAAAGAALVAMEVLADYGVTDFLGVPTMTVGIVRAWSSFGDPAAAAQLAVILLLVSLTALWIERRSRGRRRFHDKAASGGATLHRVPLRGMASVIAMLLCLAPLLFGLVLPVTNLALMSIETQPVRSILPSLLGSLGLGAASAAIAALLGLLAAYTLRTGRPAAIAAIRVVQAGYAVPGAVAAIAILSLFVALQAVFDTTLGSGAMAVTGGGILALVYAYQSRFAAVAILPCEAALQKIGPELDEAASALGAGPARILRRIHAPLALPGIATATLLVAVEVIKELPATMILRPFDLDTLAVTAHNYASDERLAQAALPALLLLAITLPATAALNLARLRK